MLEVLKNIKYFKNKADKELLLKRDYGKYPILDINNQLVKEYGDTTNFNNYEDYVRCVKKISRDFYCGEIVEDNDILTVVAYGYLYIYFSKKHNSIVDIKAYNWKEIESDILLKQGKINGGLKKKLNILYNIYNKKEKMSNKEKSKMYRK